MSPLIVVNESVEPSKPTGKSEITPNRSGSVPAGVLKTCGVKMSGVVTLRTSLDLQLAAPSVNAAVMAARRVPVKTRALTARREDDVCVMVVASVVEVEAERE